MKIAVSVPDLVFREAERLAKKLRWSRSRLYAEALRRLLRDQTGKSVTRVLDSVYGRTESRIERALLRAQTRALLREDW